MIRDGAGVDALESRLAAIWSFRDDRYSMDRAHERNDPEDGDKVEMSYIGG